MLERSGRLVALAFAMAGAIAAPSLAAPRTAPGAAAMAQAAQRFLDGLTPEQQAQVTKPLDDGTARTNWHYLQESGHVRDGLPLRSLSATDRAAVHDLLVTALSSQGYGKAAQVMWLEDVLRPVAEAAMQDANLTGAGLERRRQLVDSFDSGKYWIVVFGSPHDPDWGWTLSGHHLAINVTVADGRIALTPLFLGAAPQKVESGRYAGWRTLQHEIDKAIALMAGLSLTQRALAVQPGPVPITLVADKGKPLPGAFAGITAAKLAPAQQAMLLGLVDEYLGNATDDAALAQRAAIRSDGLGALRFAWWGPVDDPSQRFMYRIHGPSILIEFIREPTSSNAPANHVHSIVRDPRNDYGADWLRRHYTEQPHQP